MKGGLVYYNAESGNLMRQSFNFTYDYSSSLSKNKYIVTLIQGQYDFIDFNAERHRDLIGNLPINVVTIPNAGHAIWIDQPNMFRKELKKALLSNRGSH